MNQKNYKSFGYNYYSGAPVNQGFYARNLSKSRKLYMDQYDRLKQQILKRREDHEFQEVLSNYYNDFNKLAKKHPFLKTYEDDNKTKETDPFDFNQFELKKKNINALFFKYDNSENDFNFDATDKLIESMDDGNNISLLMSLELKADYKKRLAAYKINERISETDINNVNFYSTQRNIDLSIISNKNTKSNPENKVKDNQIEEKEENDDKNNLIIENYTNNNENENTKEMKEQLEKQNNKLNEININKEDELIKYKKYLKENNFPCFEFLLNPYNEVNYIPPTYLQEKQKSENKESETNKKSEYDDFVESKEVNQKEGNKANLKKSNITKKKDNQLPVLENIINPNSNEESDNPQYNILYNKEDEVKEEDYEREKFDEIKDNNKDINLKNNNANENIDDNDINKYKNGELKMMNDIIKDNNYPQFEQLINPYYQTKYLPPDIFNKPINQNSNKIIEDSGVSDGNEFIHTGVMINGQIKEENEEENEYDDFEVS